MAGWLRNASIEWRSTARPARGRYCFGTSPPKRVPAPAATMRAMELVISGARVVREAIPTAPACQVACRRSGPVQASRQGPILSRMHGSLLLSLSALFSMLPISAMSWRPWSARDRLFWTLLAVAIAGPAVVAIDQVARGWLGRLAAALWL